MNIKTIDRRELTAWLKERRALILIDTSLAEDYAAEHLPGASNACVFEVNFLEQATALHGPKPVGGESSDRDATLVVYGASERSLASATAAEKLARAGYGTVRDYRGGLEDWRAAGLPLEGTGQSAGEPPPVDGFYAVVEQECTLEWTGRSLGGKHQGTMALLPGGAITLSGGRAVSGDFGVDMASINDADLTDSALKKMLHAHLASDDFFDVANHPRAWFRLEHVETITGASPGQPDHTVMAASPSRAWKNHFASRP